MGDRTRRSGPQAAADIAFIAVSAIGGAWLLLAAPGGTRTHLSPPALAADLTIGVASCLALWFRRRWPVTVGLLTAISLAMSVSSGVASMVALLSVAMYRRPGVTLAVAGLHQLAVLGYYVTLSNTYPLWAVFLWALTEHVALVASGMYLRARGELIASLHQQVARAEADQARLADQARQAERTRIAQEMHDVLAHRVSLMALHAGGLEVRPDLPAAEVHATAQLIRSTARQALEELRGVIGVLRDNETRQDIADAAPSPPQPTLADLAGLVEDSRRAGMDVRLCMRVDNPAAAPAPLGRDTYRIVREALTNAGKHARGAATTVSVSGCPGHGLRIVVRNRLPPLERATQAPLPGAGLGLVGLTERVALAGGTLRHGPDTDYFVVDAALVWTR